MKVVVTGGSGFIGAHTVKALQDKGYDVFNFDLKTKHDIRWIDDLLSVIQEGDKVLHLAAIARFNEADNDPLSALETNALGTKNVAYACLQQNAERLVYASTGSVYMPIEETPPITERFKARGNSQYACTKFQGEEYIRKYRIPHIVLRYAHLYGEGKIGHGAIGGFIDRMSRGLAPVLYGGLQSNDMTYIKDIVQANLLAIETPHLNEVFNIGTGEELVTEDVFNIMADLFGYHKEFERLPARTVDPLRFVYDISKARKMLGYEPKYNFRDGMKDWMEKGINL